MAYDGFALYPIARRQEVGVELVLCAAGFGFPVVAPLHDRRQGHEDGFGAAAGLEAEEGAAVPD